MSNNCTLDEIDLQVITCSVRRLNTEESLQHIKKSGIQISSRTLFYRKKKIKEQTKQRIILNSERQIEQHFRVIDSLEDIQKNLWIDLEKTNDVNLRLKIMNTIKNNEMSLHEYYCAIPDTYNKQLTSFTKLGKMENLSYKEVRKSGIEMQLKHLNTEPKKLHEITNPHLFNKEEKQELESELEELS